ncbi:hypothetical protein GCM10007301_13240 [Azorhizobium oxalatiphilum]|uniref:HTH luxR-type domain-containing protein n=1 Tax=Azorhizobium oxalatiphilum TaxID=980631 RepID=A0A917F7Q1_9HYPH|nr:LuxR C-terminal-related transcriptional regulator [Azorhizobium oxalatiphilum]GGF55023.1 hypothetical protein GCM10007301_13240 [Azorhizobium oxalatiphilum]
MKVDLGRLQIAMEGVLPAAMGVTGWTETLDQLQIATGAQGVNLMSAASSFPAIQYSSSISRSVEAYFAEGWAERDYRARAIPLFQTQRVIIDSDFMSGEDYNNEFFRFMGSHKLKYSALVGFGSGKQALSCSLHRHADAAPYSPEEALILNGLSERLTLAASFASAISDAKVEGLGEAFDRMKTGAIFFDRGGHVVRMNACAEALMGEDLNVSRGEIRARLPAETKQLHRQIRIAAGLAGDVTMADAVRLSRDGKRPLVIRFQQVSGFIRDFFARAKVMAIITDLEMPPQPDPRTIQQAFGLTPAEAVIALLLAQRKSVQEIAEVRAISQETARIHIKSIFRKLDVNRQAEVVSIIASLR